MEGTEKKSGTRYTELMGPDDVGVERQPQVSISAVRAGPRWRHGRLAVRCLGLLSALLLVVDIGLGAHYNGLGENHNATHIGDEITRIQAKYAAARRSRDEAKRQLAREVSQQETHTQELQHQRRRNADYEVQLKLIEDEKAVLHSQITLAEESCKYCLSRWILLNSKCYYFPFLETSRKDSWYNARDNCIKKGADLAIIDSRQKQMSITKLINDDQVYSRAGAWDGFWIGLRDEQRTWTWLTGKAVSETYWIPGEPNNKGHENCAATYARDNPLETWNNAPCSHSNKWICEMEPRQPVQ
ncbi:CD209 antigen-like isoform X1 [Lampris incognitus]|uniref:CD209 antigen-like isoform X1 n=1 Tax=Lampris incognitus TaxID=2546036 RepID=UPI0024B62A26|nr:CD209 antigen-like isoform X1 [Lampris incognitus]